MAVLHDVSASIGLTANAGGVTNRSLTIAANNSRYLIVHLAFHNTSTTIPNGAASVKWNGTESLALLWELSTGAGASSAVRAQAWGLKNPTAGSFNVTVTNGSGTIAGGSCIASSYYNVHQTTPTGTARTEAQSGATQFIGTDSVVGAKTIAAVARAWDANTAGLTVVGADSIPAYYAQGLIVPLSTGTATTVTPGNPFSGSPRGDFILAVLATKNTATHNCSTSGWQKFAQSNGVTFTTSLWYAQYPISGSLADPVFTWTGAVAYAAQTFSYKDATGTIAALGSVQQGTINPHTSAGGNTTAARSLAVYIDACAVGTAIATPSGWTENQDSPANAINIAVGSKKVATSGTASGAISVTGGVAAYLQRQVEIFAGNLQATRGTQTDAGNNRCLLAVFEEDGAAFNTLGWGAYTAGAGPSNNPAGIIALLPAPPVVTLTQTARFDNAQTFYAPKVTSRVLESARFDNAQSFFAPTVTVAVTAISVQPARHDNAQEFYAPSVTTKLGAPLHTNAQTFFAPKLRTTVKAALASLFAPAPVFYAPKVSVRYAVGALHVNAQTFFAPKVSARLTQSARHNNAQTVFAPRLGLGVKATARVDNAQAYFAPRVTVRFAIAARHDNAQALFVPSVTRVAAPVLAPLHTNAQSFFGPKLTHRRTVGALFANPQSFFAPVVRFTATVRPSLHTNGQAFFGPRVRASVTPALHTNAQAFYAPAVLRVGAPLQAPPPFANPQAFFGPALTATYTPGARFDNAQAFFAPTVKTSFAVQPTRFDNAQAFYAPARVQALKPPRHTNAQAFFAPARAQVLAASLHTNQQTFHAHTLSERLALTARHDNAQSFFAPSVRRVAPPMLAPLHTNGQTFFGPALKLTLKAARFDNAQAFFGPRVARHEYVAPARYDNAQTFFGPRLAVRYAVGARVDNGQAFFGLKLAERVTLTARHTNAQTFFAPSVARGKLLPPLHTNGQAFFAPAVRVRVYAVRFDNLQAFFAPKVNIPGAAIKTPLHINAQSFFGPSVSFTEPVTPEPGDGVRVFDMFADARAVFNGHDRLMVFTGERRNEFMPGRVSEFSSERRTVFRSRLITEGELVL